MTKIKLCGLKRPEDVIAANALAPDYIGFVFAKNSRRYVSPREAAALRRLLDPGITAVGIFTDEDPAAAAALLNSGVIDAAQLHGSEDEACFRRLRELTDKPIIQAFRIKAPADVAAANRSGADLVLLDAGAGSGTVFDWSLIRGMARPFLLAGGLCPENAADAIRALHPYGLDVSSGIETGGSKDHKKMAAFVAAVREEDGK